MVAARRRPGHLSRREQNFETIFRISWNDDNKNMNDYVVMLLLLLVPLFQELSTSAGIDLGLVLLLATTSS